MPPHKAQLALSAGAWLFAGLSWALQPAGPELCPGSIDGGGAQRACARYHVQVPGTGTVHSTAVLYRLYSILLFQNSG